MCPCFLHQVEKHPALQSSVLEHTDKLFPRNWILKQNGFHGKGPANECSRIPRDDLLFRVATAEEDEFDAFLYTFGLQKRYVRAYILL